MKMFFIFLAFLNHFTGRSNSYSHIHIHSRTHMHTHIHETFTALTFTFTPNKDTYLGCKYIFQFSVSHVHRTHTALNRTEPNRPTDRHITYYYILYTIYPVNCIRNTFSIRNGKFKHPMSISFFSRRPIKILNGRFFARHEFSMECDDTRKLRPNKIVCDFFFSVSVFSFFFFLQFPELFYLRNLNTYHL